DLVSRYARTHGPFTEEEFAARFGIAAESKTALGLREIVLRMTRAGRLVEGAFRRYGLGRELCDAEVLRGLRRKSLARVRGEVGPVDEGAYARFLCAWQTVRAVGAPARRRGPDALLEAVAQLEGCPLPASALLEEILPARVADFRESDLDALSASGEIV